MPETYYNADPKRDHNVDNPSNHNDAINSPNVVLVRVFVLVVSILLQTEAVIVDSTRWEL